MASRLELQNLLEELIGNENVYFNPPDQLSMMYPAIKYNIYTVKTFHSDNGLHRATTCYGLTVIGRLPNVEIVNKLLQLPMCSYDRNYVSDGLHHDTLLLYY